MKSPITIRWGWAAMICVLSYAQFGCVTYQQGLALSPAGPRDDAPMIVRKVFPGTPAETSVQIGDKIVALDSTPIRTVDDFFSAISQQTYTTVTIEKPGSKLLVLPINRLRDETTKRLYASPLGDGETFTYRQKNADGEEQFAGLYFMGPMRGHVMATVWDRDLRIIELRTSLSVSGSCTDCALKNIALMDWAAKSWIQPVKTEDVAWAIYPPLNQPAPPVNVPPPVPVTASAVSSTSGTFSASYFAGNIYGTYAGQTTTIVVPQYDYTLTNVALAHNLGAAIQNDKIRQQNALRQRFVSSRIGNLRQGSLNPGERVLGHVFFAAPKNLAGPYVVFISGGEDRWSAVRFDVPVVP